MPDAETAVFEAECGKGTYVRALARDMGRVLDCLGHVIALRRTRVGSFDEAGAVALAALRGRRGIGRGGARWPPLPVEAALEALPGLVGGAGRCGKPRARSVGAGARARRPVLSGAAYAHFKGQILALGELEKGAFRPTRVFNFG